MHEIAWAAGLFEGEGSCSCRLKSGRHYLRLSLTMTDEESVRRFHAAVGYRGNVTGPYHRGENRLSLWTWQCGAKDAREIVGDPAFFDKLGTRRRNRISEVLALEAANPPHLRRITNDPATGAYRYAPVLP